MRGIAMTTTRYPAIAWPWVGVILCLALLGQEYMLLAAGPNAPLTVYRIVLMTVGITSVALVLLPPRRMAYFLAFFVCAILIAYALYLQHVEGLDPCPLCIFQRICVIAMGVVFLVAGFHNPGRVAGTAYALLLLIAGGIGIGFAGRQVWLQSLPADQVPACGMGLDYMLDTLPFTDVLKKVFEGSGECAEKSWEFLHLSLAAWMLVFFTTMIVTSFALIRRDP
jgi:protein dithiol:quinone oxidoreductase